MDFVRIVRNQSARSARPDTIVLHTTEGHNRPGIIDLEGLASWFDRPVAQASSHLGIDQEGNCVRMVTDDKKAWTCMAYNSRTLNIEQIGFSAEDRKYWVRDYHRGLRRTAQALARWSVAHGIPLKHGLPGVVQHKHLGQAGGGHNDCGPGYPEEYVTIWARIFYYRLRGWNKLPHRIPKLLLYKRRVISAQKRYGVAHPSTT